MLSDSYHICKSSALRLFADTISYNHNTESICPTAMRTHQKDTLITKFFTMDKPLLKTHSESLPLETPLVLIFLTFLFQAHWKHLFLFLHLCKKPVFCTTVFRFCKSRISAGLPFCVTMRLHLLTLSQSKAVLLATATFHKAGTFFQTCCFVTFAPGTFRSKNQRLLPQLSAYSATKSHPEFVERCRLEEFLFFSSSS